MLIGRGLVLLWAIALLAAFSPAQASLVEASAVPRDQRLVHVDMTPKPEPDSYFLLGAGVLLAIGIGRRIERT